MARTTTQSSLRSNDLEFVNQSKKKWNATVPLLTRRRTNSTPIQMTPTTPTHHVQISEPSNFRSLKPITHIFTKEEEHSEKEKEKPEKEKTSKVEEKSKKYRFTFLVKIGEKDYFSKWSAKCSSIEELKEKLLADFELTAGNYTFLYLDKEFDEYVKWPSQIEDLPSKLKVMVVQNT